MDGAVDLRDQWGQLDGSLHQTELLAAPPFVGEEVDLQGSRQHSDDFSAANAVSAISQNSL
jgi:hypothetical protein